MKAKESRYFSWLLKSKSMQFQIEQWLVDNEFDVYSEKGRYEYEVIKFRKGNSFGVLWDTGFANKVFIDTVKRFKK